MHFNEFQDLAERTSAYRGVRHDRAQISSESDGWVSGKERLMAAGMGLAGEACELLQEYFLVDGEVDRTKKELGDTCFYLAEICSALGVKLNDVVVPDFTRADELSTLDQLVVDCGLLTDYLKKITAHRHEIDWCKLFRLLGNVGDSLLWFADDCGFDLLEVMKENNEKLFARYGDKFSTEASVNRTC